jgi:hypothetical protein
MLIEVVGVFILGLCTLVLIAAVEQMEEEEDEDGKKD